jgi:hypothetical protein
MRYAVNHCGQVHHHTSAAVAGLHAQQLADATGAPCKVLEYVNGNWSTMAKISPPGLRVEDATDAMDAKSTVPMSWMRNGVSVELPTYSRETDPAMACELVDSLRRTRHAGFSLADL